MIAIKIENLFRVQSAECGNRVQSADFRLQSADCSFLTRMVCGNNKNIHH